MICLTDSPDFQRPMTREQRLRHWAQVHIRSDRSPPVHLPDRKPRNVVVPIRWERTR